MPLPDVQAAPDTQSDTDGEFEMANLRPSMTGLPFVVFVSQQGGARHGPRIKVSPLPRYTPSEATTITLEQPPRPLGAIGSHELAAIRRWIELNRAVLEAYWDGSIDYTEDMLAQIKSI